MYLALFVIALVACMIHVGRNGDSRDMLAGGVVTWQFAAEHIFSGSLLVSATVFTSALFLHVLFSVKPLGIILGVLSGVMALWAGLTWFGVFPDEPGQGVTFNYHNHITLLMYGQLFALWRLSGGGHYART